MLKHMLALAGELGVSMYDIDEISKNKVTRKNEGYLCYEISPDRSWGHAGFAPNMSRRFPFDVYQLIAALKSRDGGIQVQVSRTIAPGLKKLDQKTATDPRT
jgi:hypothetical protein